MALHSLIEQIEMQRVAWEAAALDAQTLAGRTVDTYGTVEYPMSSGLLIMDTANKVMLGISRFDEHYTRRHLHELRGATDAILSALESGELFTPYDDETLYEDDE